MNRRRTGEKRNNMQHKKRTGQQRTEAGGSGENVAKSRTKKGAANSERSPRNRTKSDTKKRSPEQRANKEKMHKNANKKRHFAEGAAVLLHDNAQAIRGAIWTAPGSFWTRYAREYPQVPQSLKGVNAHDTRARVLLPD